MLLQYKTESVKSRCLSPQNQSYSLHQSDSKGSFGSKSHRLDEVGTLTHAATEISAGGNLSIISTGNQTIEAAKLNAGGNLTITSTQGSISFNAVKDLLQHTHEKSNSNLAWQSAKGHGSTDETIRQSQLAVTGQTLINAAQTVKIDIQQVDAQSVHDAITAMVNSDPRLAWLQTEEAKGNIDWHQVKAIHDSWQYKQSGLGPGAALAVAIVMSIYAGPAGAAMLGLDAAAVAGSAAAIEFAAGSAAIGGLATTSTLSLISNQGDLGAMFADITSSNAIKGYLTAAATAGFTEGVIKPNLSGTDVANSTATNNQNFNNITHGFNISQLDGMAGFTTYTATQALAGATINTTINGGSFADNLSNSLSNAATTIVGALLYNQVGNYAKANNLLEGDPQKVILHALVGGLLTQANGGDFATGAVAAGVSEAVSKELATLVNNNPALQNMTAQLIGIATTALTGGDVNQAANVASLGDLYNNQLHPSDVKVAKALYNAQGANKRFTLAQFEDALRSANNSKTGETATSNIIYNPNAPAGQNSQSSTDMYTGQKIDEMKDSNGGWITNPVTGQQIQNLATPSTDLINFMQTYTGGSNSVYSWSAGTSQTPTNTSANTSPFADGWSYMGANSAGLSGMPPIDTRTQAQIDADQNRFAIGVAALPVVIAAAPFVATTSTATQSVMAIGGTASFVFDTAGQYVSTNGFTTGDYRLGQSIFAAATGAALAPLGLSWTSTGSLSLNLLNSAVIGGTGSATTTTFNNYYYNENKDVASAAEAGAAFGVGGLGASYYAGKYIAPLNSNISILLQDYYKNFLISNGAGTTVSGFGSFVETPDTKNNSEGK